MKLTQTTQRHLIQTIVFRFSVNKQISGLPQHSVATITALFHAQQLIYRQQLQITTKVKTLSSARQDAVR